MTRDLCFRPAAYFALCSCADRWPIVYHSCPLFSFALIEFSLKRFLFFIILIALFDLARLPNLPDTGRGRLCFARWPSTLLARWPIVELASSINIP